jgi:hypothetical protein
MPKEPYRVLKPIFGRRTGRTYNPGDVIYLSADGARAISGCVRSLGDDAPGMAPVTDVSGIGEERARGLAQMGIRTVSDLVSVDPTEIELTMVNVSLSMVKSWQSAARDLLGTEKEEVDYDG